MILLIWLHNKTASPPLNYGCCCSSYCPPIDPIAACMLQYKGWGRNNKAHIRRVVVYGYLYLQFVEDDKYCNAIYWRPLQHCHSSLCFSAVRPRDSGFMAKLEQHNTLLLSQSSPISFLLVCDWNHFTIPTSCWLTRSLQVRYFSQLTLESNTSIYCHLLIYSRQSGAINS